MDPRAFGYDPDPAGAAAFVKTLAHPTLAQAGPELATDERTDVFLYEALLKCQPSWQRGSQGSVGSCVGWAAALCVDVLAACDIVYRKEPEVWAGRTIEASLYGLSRVEARGRTSNLGGDGSTGFHAAKAIRDFGALHYGVDYGGTKFEAHSSQRERDWGRNGLADVLEPFPKERRGSETTLCTPCRDVAKAVSNGYAAVCCSLQGFWSSRGE